MQIDNQLKRNNIIVDIFQSFLTVTKFAYFLPPDIYINHFFKQ